MASSLEGFVAVELYSNEFKARERVKTKGMSTWKGRPERRAQGSTSGTLTVDCYAFCAGPLCSVWPSLWF